MVMYPGRGHVGVSAQMPLRNCAPMRLRGIFHFPYAPIMSAISLHHRPSSQAGPSSAKAQITFPRYPFWHPNRACWLGWATDRSTGHDSLCARVNTTLSQRLSEPWGHLIPQSFSFLPSLASTQNARSNGLLPSHILTFTLLFVPLPWLIFPFPLHFPVKLLACAHIAPFACPAFPYMFHLVNTHSSFKTRLNLYTLLCKGESPPASSYLPFPVGLTHSSMFASYGGLNRSKDGRTYQFCGARQLS